MKTASILLAASLVAVFTSAAASPHRDLSGTVYMTLDGVVHEGPPPGTFAVPGHYTKEYPRGIEPIDAVRGGEDRDLCPCGGANAYLDLHTGRVHRLAAEPRAKQPPSFIVRLCVDPRHPTIVRPASRDVVLYAGRP